jgi:hypothetical protein
MTEIIIEYNGHYYDFASVVNLADDEICRDISGMYDNDQEWVNAYVNAHKTKFNEAFAIN